MATKWDLATNTIQLWYDSRHRYLDVAGIVADCFRDKYPNFKLDEASTKGTTLSSEEDETSIIYTDSQAYIAGTIDHKSSEAFGEMANYFFENLISHLGIRSVTRMGNRMTHRTEFKSAAETELWLSKRIGALIVAGHNPFSTTDDRLKDHVFSEFSFRTNDKKFDFYVNLKKVTRLIKLQGDAKKLLRDQLKSMNLEVHTADLDIDIKTLGSLEIPSLDPALFFKSNRKLIYSKLIPWIEGSPSS